jgi:hypothetical protein
LGNTPTMQTILLLILVPALGFSTSYGLHYEINRERKLFLE